MAMQKSCEDAKEMVLQLLQWNKEQAEERRAEATARQRREEQECRDRERYEEQERKDREQCKEQERKDCKAEHKMQQKMLEQQNNNFQMFQQFMMQQMMQQQQQAGQQPMALQAAQLPMFMAGMAGVGLQMGPFQPPMNQPQDNEDTSDSSQENNNKNDD
jgi:hypothetical protein